MNQHEWLRIWKGMTPEKRDYDRFVARRVPPGASRQPETIGGQRMLEAMEGHGQESRYPDGCSCQMRAPCSFCERLTEDQVDRFWNGDVTSDQIVEEWRQMDEEAEIAGRPVRMVEEDSKFVSAEEFDRKVAVLADENWKVRRLLDVKPWRKWPAHLRADLFKRIGFFPDEETADG